MIIGTRGRIPRRLLLGWGLAILASPGAAVAQTGDFGIPAGSALPNYDRISIGQREGIEANAFVARTNDAGANWYNPAGLAASERSALNASANAYEFTGLAVVGAENARGGTRFSSIGSFFGGVLGAPIIKSDRWRLGFSYTTPVSWEPSEIEGQLSSVGGSTNETLLFSSLVTLRTSIPAVNVGYRLSPRVRVGAGLGYAVTSLNQRASLSDRLVETATAETQLRSIESDGTTGGLLVTGGVQVDVATNVHLGATITSPGLRVTGGSLVVYQLTQFAGDGSRDLSFRDDDADFDYKFPLKATIGAAVTFGKAEIEADLRYHGSRDTYVIFGSDVPATVITTDAAGVPTVTTASFADIVEDTKAVYNLAIGGHYAFSPSFRAHAGFFTDDSPVDNSETSLFRKLDLTGFSGGVSFGAGRLKASAGLSSSRGTSEERQVGPSLGGFVTTTRIKVTTYNLLYAISFEF
jgi:long-subunit fatty acid transport protein